jgi:hypothetical protein
MFNVLSQINWLAVLLATVAMSMLGAAWFMGVVGKHYAIALGRTNLGDQKPSALFIAGPMLCCAAVVVTDARKIAQLVEMLERGETIYG